MSSHLTSRIFRAAAAMAVMAFSLPISAEIEWLEREIDFGTFQEALGPKTAGVRFVNRGPEPTVITRVRPSCGCTGETHTEGIIEPGDTATISVTYNPIGRPGRFEKTVRVYTGEHSDVTTIPIKGTVIGTPATLMAEYPVEAGALRLSDAEIRAGEVRYGSARHFFLKVYNQGNDTIRPVWTTESKALSIDLSHPAVPPGDVASFSIYFNTRDLKEPGPYSTSISFSPDRDSRQSAEVAFTADVAPDIRSISPEAVEAGPRIILPQDRIDLGCIRGKKAITREITILNKGKSRLEIRRIHSPADAISSPRYPARLDPGKKGKATIVINPADLPDGPASFNIDIYSNDPVHPVSTVKVSLLKE